MNEWIWFKNVGIHNLHYLASWLDHHGVSINLLICCIPIGLLDKSFGKGSVMHLALGNLNFLTLTQ